MLGLVLPVAVLAACQGPAPVTPPSPSAAPSSTPTVFGTTDPGPVDPLLGLYGRVLTLGEPVTLEEGTPEAPFTWAIVDRDREKATLSDDSRLTPHAPGGLTLEVRAGERRAWVHYAVVARQELGASTFRELRTPSYPAFPRPVIVRDTATWARVWPGWYWQAAMATWTPPPATAPGQPPPPHIPPPPGEAPGIAFPERAVLLVNMAAWTARPAEPVVTHIEGTTIHMAVPDAYFAAMGDRAQSAGYWSADRGFAFEIPAPPRGAAIRLAPFAEAPRHAEVSSEPEDPDAVPMPGVSPGPVIPPGQSQPASPEPSA